MDACQGVERELERLAKKYSNIKEHTDSSLTELVNQIANIQQDLVNGRTLVQFSGFSVINHLQCVAIRQHKVVLHS